MPAIRLANLTLVARSHSLFLQFNAYNIPALNVSPAPIGLNIISISWSSVNGHGSTYSTTLKSVSVAGFAWINAPVWGSKAAAPSWPHVQQSNILSIPWDVSHWSDCTCINEATVGWLSKALCSQTHAFVVFADCLRRQSSADMYPTSYEKWQGK